MEEQTESVCVYVKKKKSTNFLNPEVAVVVILFKQLNHSSV